jgi:hypothetical protein
MTKVDGYLTALHQLADWDEYLRRESGLPGPRGNLELAAAVARAGAAPLLLRYAAIDAETAPTNTTGEFLAFCGVLGLGRMVAEGRSEYLARLRAAASDPRWRVREAAAMALQTIGDADVHAALAVAEEWSKGDWLEQRAAAAGLCEPRLLRQPTTAMHVLAILDRITGNLASSTDRRSDDYRTLRQGLAYCWSVAVAALPEAGKPAMEKWLGCEDRDVQWVMRENLKKNRLVRADPAWVEHWLGLQTQGRPFTDSSAAAAIS